MLDPKPTKNHAYKFQRIFTDGAFMAGGMLVIPSGEMKPLKPARDNTYVSRPKVSEGFHGLTSGNRCFIVHKGLYESSYTEQNSQWHKAASSWYQEVCNIVDLARHCLNRIYRQLVSNQESNRYRCYSDIHASS